MTIRTFLLVALCGLAELMPLSALALSPSAMPRLIRTPQSPAVYYATASGHRYTFPNERIYQSWYQDFSSVELVTPEALAGYRLSGAIVYRPGTLIKLTTDPKVYLVTEGGVLRWIETEAVARQLFGDAWSTRIHDLSDAFFPAYTVGSPINSTSLSGANAFSLQAILSGSAYASIENNQLSPGATTSTSPTIPTPTTSTLPTPVTHDLTLIMSDAQGVRPGDSIRIHAYATGGIPENITITSNNVLEASCSRTGSCSYTFSHLFEAAATSYTIRAEATFADGTRLTKTLVVPIRDKQAGALRLTLLRTETRINTPIDIRADWRNTNLPPQKISIIVDGFDRKLCFNTTVCRYTHPADGSIGSKYSIKAIAEDTSGNRWETPTQIISIVANEHPVITGGTNAPVVFTGESIEVNAQASDDDTIQELSIQQNGQTVATCQRANCQYITPTLTQAGQIQFVITAKDSQGLTSQLPLDPIIVLPRS